MSVAAVEKCAELRRLAFGYTADKGVRALILNHCLDLSKQTETRNWHSKESVTHRSLDDSVGLEMEVSRCDRADTALRPRLIRRHLTERATKNCETTT